MSLSPLGSQLESPLKAGTHKSVILLGHNQTARGAAKKKTSFIHKDGLFMLKRLSVSPIPEFPRTRHLSWAEIAAGAVK
jgi:hypothetical protein